MHNYINEICENFIVVVNYTHPDGERYSGYVTKNLKFLSVDKPVDDPDKYLFFDLLTNIWIYAPVQDSVEFKIKNLPDLGIDNPFLVHTIKDNEIINRYNEKLVKELEEKKEFIKGLFEELKQSNINTEEINFNYFVSLLDTHDVDTLSEGERDDRDSLMLCMIANTTLTKLFELEDKNAKLDIAKENWSKLIKSSGVKAKLKLDTELSSLDKESEEYEFELEEINLIKSLIDDTISEYISKLDECNNYLEIFSTWPPLLLPAPKYSLKWEALKNVINDKYRSQ